MIDEFNHTTKVFCDKSDGKSETTGNKYGVFTGSFIIQD
jgi:hypothetical protein